MRALSFCGAKPIVFHTFCISMSRSDALFHSLRVVSISEESSSTLTQSSVFSSRLCRCSSLSFSNTLVLFVDTRARLLETFPKRLLVFVGYGARFAPLVMQVLHLRKAVTIEGSSMSASAASQSCTLAS